MIGLPIAVDMPHSVSVTAAALLAAASLSAVTASPAFAAALSPRKPALPATLVVGLRSDAAAAGTVADLDADPDVRVLRSTVSTGLDAVTVTVPATDRGDAVAALRADPDVTYVENNGVATIDATSADPTYPQQWGLSRTKVPAAWDTTTGRADVVVAVIDTGVNAVSELAGRVLPGYDFVNDDADASDDQGHGTMAATVIAANGADGAGLAGVCWQCKVLPVKVMAPDGKGSATGTHDAIAKGIVWAVDNGADVINLSLGSPSDSQLMRDAVKYAADHDVLVVASAGNDGVTARRYPAAIEQAVAVAGSTSADARYSWSNYNASTDAWVDLAAPGSNAAQDETGGYFWFEGTSSAGPVVAGIAALARSANPQATAVQVRTALEGSADSVGTWVAKGRADAQETLQRITAAAAAPVVSDIAVTPASPARGLLTVVPTVSGTPKSVKMTVTLPNGRTTVVAAARAPWAMTWNSAGVTGPVTITVAATDAAGYTGTGSTTVTVDNTAPSALAALAGTVTGTTPITLTAPPDDLVKMDVYVNSKLLRTVTAAPWTVDWNTAGLTGAVPVKIVTTDRAGNTGTMQKTVTPDNAGPAITWTAPSVSGTTVLRGTVNVLVGAADPAGVAQVDLIDADGTVLATDTTAPYAFPVDTAAWNGARALTVRATDKLGLTAATVKQLTFDNTAPVLGDLTVTPTGTARGTVTVTPAVSDTALRSVSMVLTLPSGRTTTVSTTKAPWTLTWNSTGVTGDIRATVTATDTAGNTAVASAAFTVDNTAPSAAVTLGAVVTGTTPITLATPSADTARMDVYARGTLLGSVTGAPWSLDWNTAGPAGAVPLTVVTFDAAGNSTTVTRTVTVDNAGPILSWAAPTITATSVLRGGFTVAANASDAAGVTKVELLDADGAVLATDTTAPYALPVDGSAYDGPTTLTVRATDKLGQTSTVTRQVTFDNTAPTVAVTGPDKAVRGTVTISPEVADNRAVRSVSMLLTLPTGKTVQLTAAKAPWTMAWNSAGVNGTVAAVVTVTDTAGNTATAPLSFTVDNIAPSAATDLPATITKLTDVTLTAPAADTALMELLVNGKVVGTATAQPWTVALDPAGLTGTVPVQVRTTDAAGNLMTAGRAVLVDTAAPVVTVTFPAALTGTVTIKGSAADPAGVATVELLNPRLEVLATGTTSSFTWTVDTTQLAKGNAWWVIRATDKLGNVAMSTRQVTIA